MIENNVCWCGHMQDEHYINYDSCCDEHCEYEDPICGACAEASNVDAEWTDPWHEFKKDNLKYLEKLSEDE